MSDNLLPSVQQDNNIVGGNIVGGNYISLPEIKTPLRKMAENYRIENEQKGHQKEFIEELQDYMRRVPGHEQRNLEEKLISAKREDLLSSAIFLKERFAKKLYKHTFSPIAQNIFVHILSMINSSFQLKIKPLICEDKPASEVDKAIYNEIIQTVYFEVGNSELGIIHSVIINCVY
ncbi:MAG: ABC-three component system protein [Nitrospirota bacterium]